MNSRAELLKGGESGSVVTVGKSARSLLLELVQEKDPDDRMPPKGAPLSSKERNVLRDWIDQGLLWTDGVSLGKSSWEPPLKPRIVKLPPSVNGRMHPIDRLLDDYLIRRKKKPPKPSSDVVFVRRAYLDLIGILPTPTDLDRFLRSDSQDKRIELIEGLLARDLAYADHWLTFWNDLLRNDYTGTGFITGGRKQITSWLYDALISNKPYDDFVRELINPSNASIGFIQGIKWRGNVNSSQTTDMQFAQNVSQVFLGINLKCASCHDSFVDRWTLQEAYDFAAVYADKPLELNRCDKPTGKMATPRWMFPEIGQVDPKASKKERLGQLAALMTHAENGRFTRTIVNRIWARLMGRGIVHPVDAMHTKPWNEDLLDYLAVRFAQDGYDIKKFLGFVMTSLSYGAQGDRLSEEPGSDYEYSGPLPKRMSAEQFMDSIWQVTSSNPTKIEAKVNRVPKASPDPKKTGELKVHWPKQIQARWVWSPKAEKKVRLRKIVTLAFQPKSVGLIATCDNAFEMKVNGKRVALSSDWQKPVKSILPTDVFKKGKNLIEVDAEMFGGASGFIARLGIQVGGKLELMETDATWEYQAGRDEWKPAKALHAYGEGPWGKILNSGSFQNGTSAAGPPVRAALVKNDFLMRSLGRPHRDQVVTSRPRKLTTLQAIDLANGEILARHLSRGAGNLAKKHSIQQSLPEWLFRHALSRPPTSEELLVLTQVANDPTDAAQVEDLLWMVFMLPDFQIIR